MPIYEYRCPECGAEFEKMQKISEGAPPCPSCGHSPVVKKVSASSFVLKGSGWYRDHYGLKKSSASGGASEGGATASAGASSSSTTGSGGSGTGDGASTSGGAKSESGASSSSAAASKAPAKSE